MTNDSISSGLLSGHSSQVQASTGSNFTRLPDVILAQASPPPTASASSAASSSSAAAAQSPVQVFATQLSAAGASSFALPINPAAIARVEVVDLDLILVTTSGQRLLLPEGALLATTSPDTALLRFVDGQTLPLAGQLKRVGEFKPVEGGSFRLQSSDLKPMQGVAEKSGDGIAQGQAQGGTEKAAPTSEAQIAQIVAELTKVSQSLQSASASETTSGDVGGLGAGLGAGAGPGTGLAVNSLASATPGAPPKTADSDKTADPNPNTNNNTAQDNAPRTLQSPEVAKVSGVATASGGLFADVSARALLAESPLKVQVQSGNAVLPSSTGNGKTALDLLLPGKNTATSVVLQLVDPAAVLPPGWTVNGQSLAAGESLRLNVNGAATSRLNLAWDVAQDGSAVTASTFQVSVKFYDASGALVGTGEAPLTFEYGDIRLISSTYLLDNNSNQILSLPARGVSYDFQGTSAADAINAGDGHDIVRGLGGADVISGGRGDDFLIGGAGGDTMDGGTGDDTASYEGSSAVVVALDGSIANSGGDALGDVLTNIENLKGSSFADHLIGNAQVNRLSGGDGDDVLQGGLAGDALDGGAGSDTASYAQASAGAAGFGVTASLQTPTQNTGEASGDTYISIENLRGSAFADILTGDAAANKLEGLAGDDLLEGLGGADVFDGGLGSDTATYANAAYTALLSGGARVGITASLADALQNTGDAAGDTYTSIENLTGSAFNDFLAGDANINRLDGGSGDDVLLGAGGADVLVGGEGSDSASYANAILGVLASLANPALNTGDAQGDTYSSIENLIGTDFADTLIGDGNANILTGGKGADILQGNGGADTLMGGDGIDTASYADSAIGAVVFLTTSLQSLNAGSAVGHTLSSIENLTGSAFDDLLVGDEQANTIRGGAGNDTLDGGAGTVADKLDGGSGTDTVSYDNATAGVALSLGGGGTAGDATGDEYTSIENAVGSSFDDSIEGNSADNLLYGGDGNDTLSGAGGNDTLYGEAGDDVLKNTGSGIHIYDGGSGNNTVSYEGFVTAIGADLTLIDGNTNGVIGGIERYINIQNLTGGTLSDTLSGNSEVNILKGGGGADFLSGRGGNDLLLGEDGNDALEGGSGADVLNGGTGTDTASYANASSGVVIDLANLSVGTGRGTGEAEGDTFDSIEVVAGSLFSDYIYAGNPAATGSIAYSGGANSSTILVGGTSFAGDTVDFSGSTGAITVDLTSQTGSGGWAAGATFSAIENIVGSSFDDSLKGDAQANRLLGEAGNDNFFGSVGASDTYEGGTGVDTISYAEFSASQSITADLSVLVGGYATVTVAGGSQADQIKDIENLTGSQGADNLRGDANANGLQGGGGADSLFGAAGDDTLDGGADNDILEGGSGADTLIGGSGIDTASYANAAARLVGGAISVSGMVANLSNPGANEGDAQGDSYSSVENLTGSAFDDLLTGDAGDNILDGGAGNDVLIGGAGADQFIGGSGTDQVSYAGSAALTIDLRGTGLGSGHAAGDVLDNSVEQVLGSSNDDVFLSGNRSSAMTMDGGAGSNTVSYQNASTGATANLLDNALNAGSAASDVYANIQNLTGSDFADVLTGDEGDNTLDGGNGDDVLEGGAGADRLIGGGGIDTASYASSTAGGVTVNLLNPTNNLGTDALGDTYSGIENILGSAFADNLTGDASANRLEGGSGDDTLDGGTGDDVLVGGAGADSLTGGLGIDTADYSSVTSALTVNLALPANSTGDANGDVIDASVEIIQGSLTAANTFYGRATAEEFRGGAEADTFYGSAGADTFMGGAGIDTANYSAGGPVTVNLLTNIHDGTDALGDSLNSIETVVGSAFDDILTAANTATTLQGGGGNDTLTGGTADDVLVAGDGNDTLIGGAGNDSLDLRTSTGNTSLAGDWADGGAGNDVIQISQSAIAGSFTLDGGADTDTLQFYATSAGALNLQTIFPGANASQFNSFEVLDLASDGVASTVNISAAAIRALVDAGASSRLTLRLSANDSYTIESGTAGDTNTTFSSTGLTFRDAGGVAVAAIEFVYA